MAFLRVQRKGSSRSRTYALPEQGDFIIGRSSSSDLSLNDRAVSRHHCAIRIENDGSWAIRDLDSMHAFKVNHDRKRFATLAEGDLVRVGMYQFTFHEGTAPARKKGDRRRERTAHDVALAARDASEETAEPSISSDSTGHGSSAAMMAELNEQVRTQEATIAELKAALEDANTRADADAKDDDDDDAIRQLRADLSAATGDIEALRDERDRLNQELQQALTSGIAATPSETDDSRSGEIEHLRSKAVELESELATLKADRDRALAERDRTAQEHRDELGGVHAERDALRAELESSRAELDEARAQLEAAAQETLEAARVEHEKALDALLTERDAAIARVAELEASIADEGRAASELRNQIAGLHAEHQRLSDENADLSRRLDEAIAAGRTAEEEAGRIEEALREERAVRQRIETELAELQSLRDEVRVQLAGLESAHEREIAHERDLEAQLASANTELTEKDAKLAEAERRAMSLEKELQAAQESGATARSRHAAEREEIDRQLNEAASRAEESQRRAAELSAQLEKAEAELTAARRAATASSHANGAAVVDDEARRRVEKAEKRAALAHQNLEEYREQLRKIAAEREQAISRTKILNVQLEKLRNELTRTRADARRREELLTSYIQQMHGDAAADAQVLELTEDEIRRAQARGATIVEM